MIELSDQSLDNVEKFCYLGNRRARGSVVDSVITWIRSQWRIF